MDNIVGIKNFLYSRPQLKYLFLELTRKCNLNCRHCGSSCSVQNDKMLKLSDIKNTVDELSEYVDKKHFMFCITGGEPFLNPEWYDICSYIGSLGFNIGITTNGVFEDDFSVDKLAQSSVKTIAVSIDGMEKTHEKLRRTPGCFKKSVDSLKKLVEKDSFSNIGITTVVNPMNISELNEIFELCKQINVDSWKITGVEPIGEANKNKALFLTQKQYVELFDFIKKKREENSSFDITYGCSHFLPSWYDNTVRTNNFICGAGTIIASITCEGDIVSCLDIEKRDLLKQGNISKDNFIEVWETRFEVFRRNKAKDSLFCKNCKNAELCHGDSWHTWDFENSKPKICFIKGMV